MAVRVGVNGYGTIGKRVADAVVRQPDMTLVGIAKTRPSFEAERAVAAGISVYISGDGRKADFDAAGIPTRGAVAELIEDCDVVVDCTPDKVGREHARVYRDAGVRAVFQGGEKSDVAEASFSALGNYDQGRGRKSLRVVSCNTTGLARAASVLDRRYGVEDWSATIVRRAADPAETKKGPINGIVPTFQLPSHHGPDVRTILPDLPIFTTAVVVPTTLMHVHVNRVRLKRPPSQSGEIVQAFKATPRFHLFAGWERVEGTPQVIEYARDRALGRSDMMENALWEEGVKLHGSEVFFFQAIHQESIVVPENIDAIRAMFDLAPDGPRSIAMTDKALGIPPAGGGPGH